MTDANTSRPGSGRQLAAVATAAIPVVVLSSLAMAQPAAAAPAATKVLPSAVTHGALATSLQSVRQSAGVPTSVVAGSLPSRLAATKAVPATHRVVSGDTVSAIAARYGLNVTTVLSLNHLTASTLIFPGQVLRLSSGGAAAGTTAAPRPAAQPAPRAAASSGTYVVVAGDTISGIAARHGLALSTVLAANGMTMTRNTIYPGQVIRLGGAAAPAAAPAPRPASHAAPKAAPAASGSYVVVPGDTISGIAARHGLPLSTVLAANGMTMARNTIYPGQVIRLGGSAAQAPKPVPASNNTPQKPAGGASYVIKAGDTLSGIAARHGVSLSALTAANGISAASTIYAGRTLRIPGVSAASSSVTPTGLTPDQVVPDTFLHYKYPQAVVADANKNKALLLAAPAPSQAQMKEMVARTAASMGVDPALAMAFAQQESGFNQQVVSPANAIGTMQVIPAAGDWASDLVGRKLNLLDPQDNVTAGVAIIRQLVRDAPTLDKAIAGYYQGQYSVKQYGLFPDTKNYVASVKANMKLFR